jgi:hypothetical protein
VTREPALDEKIVLAHRALEDARIPHAFGGALALAYYAEPRATIDVDINVFVSPRRAGRTLDALAGLGAVAERGALLGRARRDGQARMRWGRTPFDLFFSYDPFHEACYAARRTVPFGDADIPILAPEHLIVCKTVFDRRKDWLDIEQILFTTARELDVIEVRTWSERILGTTDRRTKRLSRLVTATVGE